MSEVCIVGGGPAGTTLGARLAQLGHDVWLVERTARSRPTRGESLSPGVLPLLRVIGFDEAIAAAAVLRTRSRVIKWDTKTPESPNGEREEWIVDRSQLNQLLLEHARKVGVRVLRPAAVRESRRDGDGWRLLVDSGSGRSIELRPTLVAEARGRSAARRDRSRREGPRTVALYGTWRGRGLPERPRIEAGVAEWFWGLPLSGGEYGTLVFFEGGRLRAGRDHVGALFRELIEKSGLLSGSRRARCDGTVHVVDATPYVSEQCVTPYSIRVGEAALALDPLSASGIQKAVQTALAGAVVVNTLLQRPQMGDPAMRFYRDNIEHSASRHRRWAAERYRAVATQRGGSFWWDRAGRDPPDAVQDMSQANGAELNDEVPLTLSSDLEFIDVPCLEGDFVVVRAALRHPKLPIPVAYLGKWNVATLVRALRTPVSVRTALAAWSGHVSPSDGRYIASWLLKHGILRAAASRGNF